MANLFEEKREKLVEQMARILPIKCYPPMRYMPRVAGMHRFSK